MSRFSRRSTMTDPTAADASLIALCQQFAEAELAAWWRYCTGPEDQVTAQDVPPDWLSLATITSTPATTPAGWQAKALALSAWERDGYSAKPMDSSDSTSALLSSLLRDMAVPARNAIVARLVEQYGPFPPDSGWVDYTAEGLRKMLAGCAPALLLVNPDADLVQRCAAIVNNRKEIDALTEAGLDMTDDAPGYAEMWSRLATLRAENQQAAPIIAKMKAHTLAGVRARAAAVTAMKPIDYGINDSVPIDWHHGMLDALLCDLAGSAAV